MRTEHCQRKEGGPISTVHVSFRVLTTDQHEGALTPLTGVESLVLKLTVRVNTDNYKTFVLPCLVG